MSHEAASNKSSVGITPQTPTQLPNLTNAPPNIKNLLDNDHDWGFDIIELERVSQKRYKFLNKNYFTNYKVITKYRKLLTLTLNENTQYLVLWFGWDYQYFRVSMFALL